MPIDFVQKRKKQKYLIAIAVIVFAISGVILWFGYFRKPEPVSEVVPVSEVKAIKIDFSVLENPFLQEIQPFEQIPPFEGDIGRENPFLPY